MAAIVFKVGVLALKTISKPLADRFKNWVMNHPNHRQKVLTAAQYLHRFEVNVSRRAEGKEGRAFVGDMTDERSVEMASKLASEAFVFTVGSVLIWAEYERGQRAAAAKTKKEADAEAAEQERWRLERERLKAENAKQEEALASIVGRLDRLEEAAAAAHAAAAAQAAAGGQRGGLFGGFFGPRGLPAPAPS